MRLAIVIATMLACGGVQRAVPSPDQCNELFEHLVDLEWLETANGQFFGDGYGEARFEHKKELRRAHGESFKRSCTEQTSAVHVTCALATEDLDAALRCDTKFAGLIGRVSIDVDK